MRIAENINEVKQNIQAALARAGRPNDTVKLLAVSKTVAEDRILQAYHAGQRVFGENRVQEWRSKSENLPDDCEWHIIGTLQTNKVKYLNHKIALIHSLDRFSLLEELNNQGQKKQLKWKTLLQVNVARDEAKAGLEVEEVRDFLISARDYTHVDILGLMTIGALAAGPEETRGYFRRLRELREALWREGICSPEQFRELSMGMSQDYELAVEEGATIVRVGSVLFGERN